MGCFDLESPPGDAASTEIFDFLGERKKGGQPPGYPPADDRLR